MRVLIAMMSHETNTFSPVPTKIDRFMRNGTTLLISQDPVQAGREDRPPPRVRFVISKPYSRARAQRTRNYFISTGRAISERIESGVSKKDGDDARFQLNFGLLHAGI